YSNAETVALFEEHFQMIDRLNIQYTKELGELSIPSLMKMTPLTWTISEEKVQSFIDNNTNQITVDLEILIGRKLVWSVQVSFANADISMSITSRNAINY